MSTRLSAGCYLPASIDILISFRYVAGMFQKGLSRTQEYSIQNNQLMKKMVAKNTLSCPHCGNTLTIERA
jgi:hypothetical protein